jgi:2-polyprenyl-3-methyl-5-hydroxy-6-metoxy-1,4-benzoquinol methylase
MKFIKSVIKQLKKSNIWTKVVLLLMVILFCIIVTNNYTKVENIEGFTQEKKYVLKDNNDLYDDFYGKIYDLLVFDEIKNNYEIDEIKRTTKLNKKSNVLDVGSGSGHHVGGLNKLGIQSEGVDKSESMIKMAKKNYPKSKYKLGSVENSITYNRGQFSHITALYFTIYYIQNKVQFFENCFSWLKPGGYLILHLVNRDKFDPIINTANPLHMVSPQKYAKERIMNSMVKFKNFKYKAKFELEKERNIGHFKEIIKHDKSGRIRENNHLLYMDTQKHILSLAKSAGFRMKGKIDMVNCMYEYQYLYILQKPM